MSVGDLLNENKREQINHYITAKILFNANINNIKDLMLLLDLLPYDEFRYLSGITTDLRQIAGLNEMAQGAYRFHYLLSRHYSALGTQTLGLKLNSEASTLYFLERLQLLVQEQLTAIATLFNLKLVEHHPDILAILISQLRQAYNLHNQSSLPADKIKEIIRSNLKDAKANPDKLAEEFIASADKIINNFTLNATENSIRDCAQYYALLTRTPLIAERFEAARQAKFTFHGSQFHIQAPTYANITTTLIIILVNLPLAVLAQALLPNLIAPGLMLIIATTSLDIVPLVLPIALYVYFSNRYQKLENGLMRDLALNLAASVPEYQARLADQQVDLSALPKHRPARKSLLFSPANKAMAELSAAKLSAMADIKPSYSKDLAAKPRALEQQPAKLCPGTRPN